MLLSRKGGSLSLLSDKRRLGWMYPLHIYIEGPVYDKPLGFKGGGEEIEDHGLSKTLVVARTCVSQLAVVMASGDWPAAIAMVAEGIQEDWIHDLSDRGEIMPLGIRAQMLELSARLDPDEPATCTQQELLHLPTEEELKPTPPPTRPSVAEQARKWLEDPTGLEFE